MNIPSCQNAKFSNGRPVVAEDVKFSIEHIQNPETASRGRKTLARGETPKTTTAALLVKVGHEIASVKINLSGEALRTMLDGRHLVETRSSEGSASPSEVRKHTADLRQENSLI